MRSVLESLKAFITIETNSHGKSASRDVIGRKFRGKFPLDRSFPRTRSTPSDDLGNMTRLCALGPLEHGQA